MRIGIDHRPALFGRGGIAEYVRALVGALAETYPDDELKLYGHRLRRPAAAVGDREPALPPNARLSTSRVPAPALALAARAGLGADRVLGNVDVMHLTDYVSLGTTRAPVVATVHDVLFEEVPACYPDTLRRRLRGVTRRIVRDAAQLIVPSERSRAGLVRCFGADPGRVHVIPHGCPALPEAAPAAEHGRYVLFVGTLQPRKNLGTLIEAFDAVHAAAPEVGLVVAGPRGWMDGALVDAMAAREFVTYEGDVDRARIAALYRGALAVALPAFEEGFGFPVLEAMVCGRPVLVGADTACAELGGEGAVAVDPRDTAAMAAGLLTLVRDAPARARLGAAGRARAAAFSWERTARATHAVYEEALRS